MTQERWFRGSDEAAAFDWSRSARALDVSADIARALYVRAMQRAADSGPRRADELYLRWLQDAAKAAKIIKLPEPGRDTRVLRDAKPREMRELERLGPGRWTRSLFETDKPDADKSDAATADARGSTHNGSAHGAIHNGSAHGAIHDVSAHGAMRDGSARGLRRTPSRSCLCKKTTSAHLAAR